MPEIAPVPPLVILPALPHPPTIPLSALGAIHYLLLPSRQAHWNFCLDRHPRWPARCLPPGTITISAVHFICRLKQPHWPIDFLSSAAAATCGMASTVVHRRIRAHFQLLRFLASGEHWVRGVMQRRAWCHEKGWSRYGITRRLYWEAGDAKIGNQDR